MKKLNEIKAKFQKQFLSRADILKTMSWKEPSMLIATFAGSGFMVPASGTWGTLAGLAVGLLLVLIHPFLLALAICAYFYASLVAVSWIEEKSLQHDQGFIVCDEVIAIWLVLLFSVPILSPAMVLSGFVLFRLFDVWKPYPIDILDKKISGAWGVMVDDIVAAIYTLICLWLGYGVIIWI
jgi:phosphatidylglycerophosphatase A